MENLEKIEKWKKIFNDGFSYYKDIPEEDKSVYEKCDIALMMEMLEDLNNHPPVFNKPENP